MYKFIRLKKNLKDRIFFLKEPLNKEKEKPLGKLRGQNHMKITKAAKIKNTNNNSSSIKVNFRR